MFKKTLYEMRFRLLVFILLFFVLLVFLIISRPIIGNMMIAFDMESEELQQIPDFLKELVASDLNSEKLKTDDQFFLLSQWFAKNFGQFLPFFALIVAFPVFSRETEKKTIYFLLSRRNRSDIFKSKVLSSYFVMLLTVLSFSILAPVLMMLCGYQVMFNAELIQMVVQQIVGASFLYFLFILFSILFNDQIKPVILGIALIIIMPFMAMLKELSWLNLYPYIFGEKILRGESFDWTRTVILTVLSFILYHAEKRIFLKKEF